MKVIGVFRELGRGIAPSVPSIHSLVGTLSADDVALVVDYLRSGTVVVDVMEAVIDPVDSVTCINGGSSLVSDGVWVWRADLAYFVEKYRVGLPSDFLVHARRLRHAIADPSIIGRWNEVVESYGLAESGVSEKSG